MKLDRDVILDRIKEQLRNGKVVAYRLETAGTMAANTTMIRAIHADSLEDMLDVVTNDGFGIYSGEADPEKERKVWSEKLKMRPGKEGKSWASTPWTIIMVADGDLGLLEKDEYPFLSYLAACEVDLSLLVP